MRKLSTALSWLHAILLPIFASLSYNTSALSKLYLQQLQDSYVTKLSHKTLTTGFDIPGTFGGPFRTDELDATLVVLLQRYWRERWLAESPRSTPRIAIPLTTV